MTQDHPAGTQTLDDEPTERVELLDAKQIGIELGVNPVTVRRWINEGRLPYVKLGQARKVRRSDLNRFIEAQLRTANGDTDDDE